MSQKSSRACLCWASSSWASTILEASKPACWSLNLAVSTEPGNPTKDDQILPFEGSYLSVTSRPTSIARKRSELSGADFMPHIIFEEIVISKTKHLWDRFIKQKVFVLTKIIDIWNAPARPGPTVTLLIRLLRRSHRF